VLWAETAVIIQLKAVQRKNGGNNGTSFHGLQQSISPMIGWYGSYAWWVHYAYHV